MQRLVFVTALALAALSGSPTPVLAQEAAPAPADAQALEKELTALTERFESAMEAYYDEFRALYKDFDQENATAEQQDELAKKSAELEARDPSAKFTIEFVALAERAKGTDVAARAWLLVLQSDRSDSKSPASPARKAFDRLLADHLRSPLMEAFAQQLAWGSFGRKASIDALKKIKAESAHAPAKAAATYSLAMLYMNDEAQGEQKAQAREMLVELQRDFAELPNELMHTTYGKLAEPYLYELDHLQLHMQVPDFEAVDENGVKFKLSDYAGKVVVIDFWGMW